MQAEFRAPRRRPRVYEQYEAPLPVRGHFRADLINQHVLVCDPDHIQKIHNQGSFGKGVLSRARPDHSISDQWEQHEGLLLPVIPETRYEEMLRWAGSALSAQGLDEGSVSEILLRLSRPVEAEALRREAGGGGGVNGHEGGGAEPDPEGGASPQAKRLRLGSEVEGSCRSDADPGSDPDPDPGDDPDPDPGSDPDPDPGDDPDPDPGSDPDGLVPGPGFVLVVSDSEVGGGGGTGGVRQVRRTPICLTEYLQLSLEEEPLSIIQLWRRFQSLQPDFSSSYAAYHHYRSRGWVPRGGGGAKYGVDLMLYRKGPDFYHASYSVVVERVDDAFRGSVLRPFSWRSLAALSRITTNVSKELMVCYIIHPADLSEAELDSPVCLSRLEVQEVIVSRWVSSRERAEQDDI